MFIRHNTHTIEMTKKFAKAAEKFGSDEYKSLQEAKRDNPSFKVVIISRKTTEKKDTFKGLTYEYMEKYIKHGNLPTSTPLWKNTSDKGHLTPRVILLV